MKKWLSKTQIEMMQRCPRQWAWRYREGLKIPPSGAMKQSGVFHSVAEVNYKQKIETRKDLPLDEITDRYNSVWKEELEKEEVIFDPDEPAMKVKDQGIEITKKHHTIIAPTVQPIAAEKDITRDLDDLLKGNNATRHPEDSFPFYLKGILDVIDDTGRIRDNKAMAPSRIPKDPDTIAEHLAKDTQLSMYSLLYRLEYGKPETGLTLDVVAKDKSLTVHKLDTARNREGLRLFLNNVGHVARQIQADAFPMHTDWWGCSKKWCGYYSKCAGRMLVTVDLGQKPNLEKQLEASVKEP